MGHNSKRVRKLLSSFQSQIWNLSLLSFGITPPDGWDFPQQPGQTPKDQKKNVSSGQNCNTGIVKSNSTYYIPFHEHIEGALLTNDKFVVQSLLVGHYNECLKDNENGGCYRYSRENEQIPQTLMNKIFLSFLTLGQESRQGSDFYSFLLANKENLKEKEIHGINQKCASRQTKGMQN